MNAQEENHRLSLPELPLRLKELRDQNARFLTITVLDAGDQREVIYHFEKGETLVNLRLRTSKGEQVPSISDVYGSAFIAENEVKENYGLNISGISIDFGGKMLKAGDGSEVRLPDNQERPMALTKRFYGRCREKCPAMVNIPKYVRQIAEGDLRGAYDTVVEQAPFPAILGRVCSAPCERGCRQDNNEEAIQNRLLKRYAADSMGDFRREVKRGSPTGKKVAIIGAGASGVTAAYYLGIKGHDVTIYDKADMVGGTMQYIPRYRLPKDILIAELMARIDEADIRLELDTSVSNLQSLFDKGFDAVYAAIGTQKSLRLNIEGENFGVMDCLELLASVNLYKNPPKLGNSVAIIGGGNSAVDAARTAKRLGARNVTIFYKRTLKEMPALPQEIEGAIEEGIKFEFLVSPLKIVPDVPVKVIFQRMQLVGFDKSGRRMSVPIHGSNFTITADTIIKAVGQEPDIPQTFGVDLDSRGKFLVNKETYESNIKGVWIGGSGAALGPNSVIDSIRDGRIVASAIDKYLGGKGLPDPYIDPDEFISKVAPPEGDDRAPTVVRTLSPDKRITCFAEVELGFNKEEATREAKRCWRCDWNE
ncbi:MAG: FAD-dependent oxidoreductase [Candidatus Methanomethylicus sp.]|nr:FAD-dependent oxidoreductase [Candidatus Methanomethylicus sp.]